MIFSSANKKDADDLIYFENLYSKYYTTSCLYITKHIKNSIVAEDIVQDVFVELWDKRELLNRNESIKLYLYRSVQNKLIDYIRHSRIREELLDTGPGSFLDNYVINMIANNIEDDIHLREVSSKIETCIKNLPEQCKKVFVLSRYDNLKNKEIAEQLNISIKTVEKHITKALAEIRKQLTKEELLTILMISFSLITE